MNESHANKLEQEAQRVASRNPTQAQALMLEAAEIYLRLAEMTGQEKYMVKAQQLYQDSEGVGKTKVTMQDEQASVDFNKIIAKKPSISFKDIAGLQELKQKIRLKIIEPFRRPDVYAHFGKKVGGGILMYGPPGCGKSLIAEATAGEAQATFFSVKASDLKSKFVGETERNIAALFDEARKRAPSIIFFDEFEALGEARNDAHSVNKGMISQLLTEIDGMGSKNQQILLLAATNEPWMVDLALKRDGRFGTTLFVPHPDVVAREELIKLQVADRPMDKGISTKKLALLTQNYSGADLKGLVDGAVELAIEESLASGQLRNVVMNDFLKILKRKRPTTIAWYKQALKKATASGESEMFSELIEAGSKVLGIAG
ncbi:MAG TPA: ATP-binding protein [Candidatus Nanoarchaeia archaeon]|nr:ATP-binding protein [Candidatus Nanoarchaeia archaeon]